MRDSQRQQLYKAERQVMWKKGSTPEYTTLDECKAVGQEIVNSVYWQSKRGRKRFTLKDGRGCRNATAGSKGIHGSRDRVTLPKWARTRWVIIHEFAHILSNQTDHGTEPHGAVFCTHYLELVRELIGEQQALELEISFIYHKIRYLKNRPPPMVLVA